MRLFDYRGFVCFFLVLIFSFVLVLLILESEAFSSDKYDNDKDNSSAIEPLGKEKKMGGIENIVPEKGERLSLFNAMALDVAVPGGGHFYTGNHYWGLTFVALKLLGAYSIYYFYHDWRYRRSLYYSAKRANENIDPYHELEFDDPEGGYKTVEEYRREYDKAAQQITFAVIANVAIYAASLVLVYFNIKEINERSIPSFEIQYSCDKINGVGEGVFSLSYIIRI